MAKVAQSRSGPLQLHDAKGAFVGVTTLGVGVIEAKILGVGLGRLVGVAVGVFVAVALTLGVVVAFGVAVTATVALTVGVGVEVLEMQPATEINETTNTSAAIAVIGFKCIRLCKRRTLA